MQGSPRLQGSTQILVDSFRRGAQEAANSCIEVAAAQADVGKCSGCIACGCPCVQHDDIEKIRARILMSDMIVFAAPLYH